jgi:hypothetical protein
VPMFNPCQPCCASKILFVYNWDVLLPFGVIPPFPTALPNYYTTNGAGVRFSKTIPTDESLSDYKLIFVLGIGEDIFQPVGTSSILRQWFNSGGRRLVLRAFPRNPPTIVSSINYLNGLLSSFGTSIRWNILPTGVYNGVTNCSVFTQAFSGSTYLTKDTETFRYGDRTETGSTSMPGIPSLVLSGGNPLVQGHYSFGYEKVGRSEIFVSLPETCYGGFCDLPVDNRPFMLRLWNTSIQ